MNLSIVDVGARGGIDPRWARITPVFQALLFEPDPAAFDQLQTHLPKNHQVLELALSDQPGSMNLHICKEQELSSFYHPNSSFLEKFPRSENFVVTDTIEVPVSTLDRELAKVGRTEVDFIKIDVQGHELAVLKGASRTLPRVIGLELEVEFAELYKNQPLFGEIDTFLMNSGFQLFDLKRIYWQRKCRHRHYGRKGQLVIGDALYFRSPEDICLMPSITEGKIMNAMLVYLAYGYYDLLETLSDLAIGKGILSRRTHQEAEDLLTTYSTEFALPRFKGSQRIRNGLARLATLLDHRSWYVFDRMLGNRPP